MSEPGVEDATIRIDKWLFFARFFRSRGLSSALVEAGRLRINGERTKKPGARVRPGDVLTFPQAGTIRVVRILSLGIRRGPASEAQSLYCDIDPPTDANRRQDAPLNPDASKPKPNAGDRSQAERG